jgi:hypothetical protein
MAAGLGFKTFTTGEVLTAADTNGYLMQGVLVFDDAAARDAAITAPAEGQFAYLKDTDVTTYYTSSAWANLDTTGMVNPMTTTGDVIYSSSGSTPARLGIGSTDDVLTVAGGVPTWAAPAGAASGLTLITRNSFSDVASVTVDSCFTSTYKTYYVVIENLFAATAANTPQIQFRYGATTLTAGYYASYGSGAYDGSTFPVTGQNNVGQITLAGGSGGNANEGYSGQLVFNNVGTSSTYARFHGTSWNGYNFATTINGGWTQTAQTYTGFLLKSSSSNITGTVSVYGLGV